MHSTRDGCYGIVLGRMVRIAVNGIGCGTLVQWSAAVVCCLTSSLGKWQKSGGKYI